MLTRQQAPAHQVLVRLTGGLAALGDGPHDEGGAAFGVACDERAWLFRAEAVLGVYGAALGEAEVHLLHETVLHGACEADGEQNEVGLYLEVRALLGHGLAIRALGLDGVHPLDVAISAGETLDGDGEAALAALLVRRVGVQDQGPVGPGKAVGILGRTRAVSKDLDRGTALAVGVPETVGARIAATEDDDVLAPGGDLDLRIRRKSGHPPVLLHEVVHRQVDAAELASWHVE